MNEVRRAAAEKCSVLCFFGAAAPVFRQKIHGLPSCECKNPVPANLLGQDKNSCGATRLDALAPSLRIPIDMPTVSNGEIPPRLPYSGTCPFRSPSEGPFGALFSAALPAPAALWKKTLNAYYLFVIGLILLYHALCGMSSAETGFSAGKSCLQTFCEYFSTPPQSRSARAAPPRSGTSPAAQGSARSAACR